MARTSPAWQRLVQEGWFSSRDEAERWILSGKVRAGNVMLTSAGQRIDNHAALFVRDAEMRYVAKGGLKLEGALRSFHINVENRTCIDAGASTGGFTDCLVKHGAFRVYAVDVGYGQLAGSLRLHPNIVNLERVNIGDASLLTLDPPPTLGTVDLSYLSLRKAVPLFAKILHHTGDLICLVKPLFETDDPQARRTGVLSGDDYEPLLMQIVSDLSDMGYYTAGITHSPVTGNHGTHEFFIHIDLTRKSRLPPETCRQAAHGAVMAAKALPIYKKDSIKEIDHE